MNIPILRDFDYGQPAKGFAEIVDGKIVMKMNEPFDSEIYDVAPAFIVKEHDRDGLITEAELVSLSLVLKPSARHRQEVEWQRSYIEAARRSDTCSIFGCKGGKFPYCTDHDPS